MGSKENYLGGVRCWYREMGYTLGVGGDFNTIRFPKERFGCRVISKALEEYSEFINNFLLLFFL